ncbi:hypothetical protein ANCDUO_07902 [Ancylostoma duodenale]|uniref:Uncharacterized protein n=1 Tax=Ancylostoma duodenale TaxID=51022 RepID=A0A0C2GXH9_9BILA|nr:hypothetical protein ANCDUO_07902 [Ancylostoma duodenale]
MRRNERARSTGPTMGTGLSLRCINPIQRYGSEGAGVGSEYLAQPAGYNSYHRGSAQRLRNIVIPPPPRPSSESTNPSAMDDIGSGRRSSATSQQSSPGVFSVPYVNISPQEVFNDAPMRARGVSSSSSQCSLPTTPTRTVFPLRWDTGAGSTNVLCYTKPISPPPVFGSNDNTLTVDNFAPAGRYVNVTEAGGRPLLDREETSSPRPLNYAEVGVGTEPERVPSRCSSVGQRADVENGAVNYTLIDAEKTRALQAANGERRRNPTGH